MRRISMVLALTFAFCMTLSACQTESIPEGSTSESLHTADVVPEDQVDLKESKELVVYRYPLLGEQLILRWNSLKTVPRCRDRV